MDCVQFRGHRTLTSDLVFFFNYNRVWSISHTLFKLGIPNLVCSCILGWQSVMNQFLGHCDLDLFSKIIALGAYLLFYLR